MNAPDKIYVEIRHPMSIEYTEIIGFDTPGENTTKYIRADLAEKPETNLLEESYMRGFAKGAKEERERMLEDAVECDVYGHCSGWLTFGYVPECDFDFKPGDKVKLVIVKES